MQFTQAESFPRTWTALNVHSDPAPGGSALVCCSPSRPPCFPAGHPFLQVRRCSLTPLCTGVSWVHRLTDPSVKLPVTHSTLLENSFFFFKTKCYLLSVTPSGQTLRTPTDCSTPGFPVLHYLPEFAQTHMHRVGEAIQQCAHSKFQTLERNITYMILPALTSSLTC